MQRQGAVAVGVIVVDGRHAPTAQRRTTVIVAVAGVLIGLFWALVTWRYGADLSDEGFYWYGAQRALAGEVPIRDFMAYDVARYYWAAAVMGLLGSDGLPAARAAAWLFYLPGVALAGLIVLRGLPEHAKGSLAWLWIAMAATLCCAWVVMYYKTYDQFASLVVTALGVWVVRNGSERAFLVSGVLVGLLSIVGRNHGVYGAATLLLAALVLGARLKDLPFTLRATGALCFGALLGFIPTLAMWLLVPGFAVAFLDSVLELFRLGTTNLTLPVPWPWTLELAGLGFVTGLQSMAPGLLFLMLLVPPAVAVVLLFSRTRWTPMQRTLVGIGLAAAPYVHYALSRADIAHLSFAILPLVIFCCVVAGHGALGRIALAALVVLSCLALYEKHPYLKRSGMAGISIDGQVFHAPARLRERVALLKEAQESAGARGPLLAVPDLIGLHAMERLVFPGWEIYPLFPRKPEVVEAQLSALRSKPPAVVLWSDHALDGNESLRLSRLNPRLFEWVAGHCREVRPSRPLGGVRVYVNCSA